jgi:hypothetical protein
MRNEYKNLVGKPAEKKPLGTPRSRSEDNTEMALREAEVEDLNWFHLAQERVRRQAFVNTAMNLQVP